MIVASDGVDRAAGGAAGRTSRSAPSPTARAAAEIARSLGAPLVGADVVRLDRASFDGLRVVDEPTRRAAEDAVFARALPGRPRLRGAPSQQADLGPAHPPRPGALADHAQPDHAVRRRAGDRRLRADGDRAATSGCCSGWLLEHTQSVLDGCDGELARVRFQQSKLGAWLDTFVDDVLNVLMTASAGIGLWRAGAGSLGARRRPGRRRHAGAVEPHHHARHAPPEGDRRPHGHGLVVLGRPEAGRIDRHPGQARASAPSCSRSAAATRRSSCGCCSPC